MEILSPRVISRISASRLAARVPDLQGRVVGLLRNQWPSALVTMQRFEERLRGEYKVREFVSKEKVGARGALPEDIEELIAKCDVVINSLGT